MRLSFTNVAIVGGLACSSIYLNFSPIFAQGTKLEGGIDSLAPSTIMTIRQRNGIFKQPSSAIELKRLSPTSDLLQQDQSVPLSTGVRHNKFQQQVLPIAPVQLTPHMDVAPALSVSPINSNIELQFRDLPKLAIPVNPILKNGTFELASPFIPKATLLNNQNNLNNIELVPARTIGSPSQSFEPKTVELPLNRLNSVPSILLEKGTPTTQIKLLSPRGLPVRVNNLSSRTALSISPIPTDIDFIEINRIMPSELSDTLVTSAQLRSRNANHGLKAVSVDIKLIKPALASDSAIKLVNWDNWYEEFNRRIAVAILELANQSGNPCGHNTISVEVTSSGELRCQLLAGSVGKDFANVIMAAYEQANHADILKFPAGSMRAAVQFQVEHRHEEQGPVDEIRSSTIRGDREK